MENTSLMTRRRRRIDNSHDPEKESAVRLDVDISVHV